MANTLKMVFHEVYGNLPKSTLALVKRFNVSQADFDLMTELLGNGTWDDVDAHIANNSESGYYRPRYF